MLKVRPCTEEDVLYILNNPWEITQQEIDNFGLSDKYSKEELSKLYLEHNFNHSYVAVDTEGNPVAAFGMAVLNMTDWVCWSVRSNQFPQYYKDVTKIFNKILEERGRFQRDLDGKFERIILITSVDSDKVERWCKTIGFKRTNNDDIKEYYDCDVSIYVREFEW